MTRRPTHTPGVCAACKMPLGAGPLVALNPGEWQHRACATAQLPKPPTD